MNTKGKRPKGGRPPVRPKRDTAAGTAGNSIHGMKLTLAEAWERSLRLGQQSESESAALVRKLRDEH